MFLGIPLMVFVLSALATTFLAMALAYLWSMWASLVVLIAFGILYAWARTVTRIDEWRLSQVMQRLRVRRLRGDVVKHGGISYAPYKLHKR